MPTKLKLLRKFKYYFKNAASKRGFMSLIQPTIMNSYLTNHDFTKAQKEKLNMLVRQVESLLNNDLNEKADELIYKHQQQQQQQQKKKVKKCNEGNIWEKFTNYSGINVHHKSTRNKNLFLETSKVRPN